MSLSSISLVVSTLTFQKSQYRAQSGVEISYYWLAGSTLGTISEFEFSDLLCVTLGQALHLLYKIKGLV